MNNRIYISEKAHPVLLSYIREKDADICLVQDRTGSPIGTHADLYYCSLGELPVIDCPGTDHMFIDENAGMAGREKTNVYCDPARLPQAVYPGDCIFNAACTGKFFIHNTKITDKKLLEEAKKAGMRIIDVKQGYAKCNCLIVDERSIITSDAGIAEKCRKYNVSARSATQPSGSSDAVLHESDTIDCLLINPGNILLEGFEYGFIGGASGRICDEIIFSGDLSAHPDCARISDFITERGLKIRYFKDYPLTDIGSIVFERRTK